MFLMAMGLGCQSAAVPAPCPPSPTAGAPAPPKGTATAVPSVAPPDPRAAFSKETVEIADKITKGAAGRRNAYEWLVRLTDSFGHRLSGSASLERAIDYAVDSMKEAGLDGARREKVMVPHWVRGAERAKVVSPSERHLVMLGLGGSIGTGKKPIVAEVVVVESLEALKEAGDKVKGKIVLVNQAMQAFEAETNETGYGKAAGVRWQAATVAGKLGAVAVLIRSVTAKVFRTPHTGAMAPYSKDVPAIPAAALSPEDADHVARIAKLGAVKIELLMEAKTLPDAESANVVAELKGRELPDEVVLVGGHIDSWDVGDGANDDGSGCAMAMDAALLLKELGLIPKRTVRVVLFTNEENGLRGGKGYFDAHNKEKHAAALEADFGAGAPRGFQIKASESLTAEMRSWLPLFAGLGIKEITTGHTGSDISPLEDAGVPCLGLEPDGSHYFDVHHSQADTIDKINADFLQQNSAALALMAYLLANR